MSDEVAPPVFKGQSGSFGLFGFFVLVGQGFDDFGDLIAFAAREEVGLKSFEEIAKVVE